MKEEITIYVVTDIDGIILRSVGSNSLLALCSLVMGLSEARVIGGDNSAKLIRPITVYSTDGIIGQHWQGVDLFHRRLRECRIRPCNSFVNDFESIDGEWYNHDSVRSGLEKVSFPDLHVALQQLIPLGE